MAQLWRSLVNCANHMSKNGAVRHVRPGLHVTHYKKRAVIASDVDAEVVPIIGVSTADRTMKRSCMTNPTLVQTTSVGFLPFTLFAQRVPLATRQTQVVVS
jgi:hypothetical protein